VAHSSRAFTSHRRWRLRSEYFSGAPVGAMYLSTDAVHVGYITIERMPEETNESIVARFFACLVALPHSAYPLALDVLVPVEHWVTVWRVSSGLAAEERDALPQTRVRCRWVTASPVTSRKYI
jgi:hypothetical protein